MYQRVFEKGLEVAEKIRDTQKESIEQGARMIASAFVEGKKFFVTGSGHSHTLLTSELTITDHPTKSSYIERLGGYAGILGELYRIGFGDVVLIASNSGRNAYPVELALYAKEQGASVIAVTNLEHSRNSRSRAACGKKLMDLADVVIDNCGVLGDACLEVEGVAAAMMPTSSISNAFIAQALSVQSAVYIREAGAEVPVFESLNADARINRNDEYFEKYARMY